MTSETYPVRVTATLDPSLSRGLWLVKWLLAVPHFLILAVLWLCFGVLSIVAFFAILFTGRYPRDIFEFNVGVLRWTWRVSYYAYAALGTDRYPPFTLAEVPDYPAHLEIRHPDHLSRGLVLVKWWLLAIPHYLVVGFFVGSGAYVVTSSWDANPTFSWGGGLIGLLVLFVGVMLLFTGRYPRSMFDLVLGLNRWVLRVAGYASLMTDQYPPFRLDLGGDEPSPEPAPAPPPASPAPSPSAPSPSAPAPPPAPPASPPQGSSWGAGRVIALAGGVIALLVGAGLLVVGTTVAVLSHTARDSQGFLMTPQQSFSTQGYAIVSDTVHLAGPAGTTWPENLVGRVKVSAHGPGGQPVFVGIAPAAEVDRYLADVPHTTVTDFGDRQGGPTYRDSAGTRRPQPPAAVQIWSARTAVGDRSLTWKPTTGSWSVVVMSPDGRAPVAADVAVGATLPAAGRFTTATVITGAVLLLIGLALMIGALVARRSAAVPSPGPAQT